MNDYLVYRLQNPSRDKVSETVFGYSLKHKHWVQIVGFNTGSVMIIKEDEDVVKSAIAEWQG